MRQLNGHDASFLYSENSHANSNVTLIQIYDQSSAPGGKVRFKSVMAHIESRLERSPLFRSKLLRVPFDIDHPYWVEDENFDPEYHVRHIALPKPGDWRQFCIQASRIHARPLDMNRPLWEIYVVEGLDSFVDLPAGSFALLIKLHHAAVDVEHGQAMGLMLHDLTPELSKPEPPRPWFPEPEPGRLGLLYKSVKSAVLAPKRLLRPAAGAIRRVAPAAVHFFQDLLFDAVEMTSTRFNSVVSPYRVFDTRRFTVDEFRAIRRLVPKSSMNDAIIAVCAGSLRRYLQIHDELPALPLTAATPLYVQGGSGGKGKAGMPEVSWMQVGLATHIDDPVERLRQIHEQTAASELVARGVPARHLTDLQRHSPVVTLALASKLLAKAAARVGNRVPLANCTITNVPGSDVPLYLNGARMTYFSAIMPISDGMGLVFAVTSYEGRIIISPTSDRYLMPDPEVFSQCIRDSFQEYLALAQKLPAPSVASAIKRKPAPVRRAASRGSVSGTRSLSSPAAKKAAKRLPAGPDDQRRPRAPSG